MVKFEELIDIGKEWAAEYCKALNESQEYAEAAKGWGIDFEGGMLMVMTASGEIEDDVASFIDLRDGKCLGITILEPGQKPPREPIMSLTGSFLIWKQLAMKEIDPIQSIMQGLLNLDGDMTLALRYANAAMELANVVEKTDMKLFTLWNLGDEE